MGDHLNVKGLKAAATPPNGSGLKFGVIHTRWNDTVVDALVEGCMTSLKQANVPAENVTTINVPGAFELPYAASQMIKSGQFDAIICVGTLIKVCRLRNGLLMVGSCGLVCSLHL
jgi:6,7-dimethyl-8-ribityllumazine synthase